MLETFEGFNLELRVRDSIDVVGGPLLDEEQAGSSSLGERPGRECHAHSQRSATTGSTRVARRAGT
jgi:hypothetical protein